MPHPHYDTLTMDIHNRLQEILEDPNGFPFNQNPYCMNQEVDELCILRACNRAYNASGGICYTDKQPPELATARVLHQVAFLARCRDPPGHMTTRGITCMPITRVETIKELFDARYEQVHRTVESRRLWYDSTMVHYKRTHIGNWECLGTRAEPDAVYVLDRICNTSAPLTLYTTHATEEERLAIRTKDNRVYTAPEETTAVTGLLGTLHNNTAVDMAPWEAENEPDIEARTYDVTNLGFVCAGHTSHSTDAGRVGRLCKDAVVRMTSECTLDQYELMCDFASNSAYASPSDAKDYLVFCMGLYITCTFRTATSVQRKIKELSFRNRNCITCHLYPEIKVLIISDSSGVVLRPDVRNLYGDNLCFTSGTGTQRRAPIHRAPHNDATAMEFYFSAFFQLWPFLAYDRPPRPLLSSVQTLQAMCMPWAANVSSVAPLRCEWPLVRTPLMEKLRVAHDNAQTADLAGIPGGVNVRICFANLNVTYEDCIGVSRKSVEAGMFAHVDICRFVLPLNAPVPPVGSPLDTELHPWWKCRDLCLHSSSSGSCNCYRSMVRGIVKSVERDKDGSLAVSVVRTSRAVTGNKLATPHGQKGVMYILDESEMPVGVSDDGHKLEFDIVMSISSVINRQTLGQYYEAVRGEMLKEKLCVSPIATETDREPNHRSCRIAINGKIVQRFTPQSTGSSDYDVEDCRVSYGTCYVFPMTQLAHDKQHYSHSVSGLRSLEPLIRRSRGGAVRFGEMESLALEASGMHACLRELRSRGDMVTFYVCASCRRFNGLCTCETAGVQVKMCGPSSTLAFDHMVACMYSRSIEYYT